MKEVATVERAKSNKIYSKGDILVQISATRGQIHILNEDKEVEPHFAVIHISEEYAETFQECYCIYCGIKTLSPRFFHKIQVGLNIKVEDLLNMPVPKKMLNISHEKRKNQGEVLMLLQQDADDIRDKVEELKELKKFLLQNLFPN